MDISFVVISNGKKIDKTILVLKSIFYQAIPQYEILLCGSFEIGKIPSKIQNKIRYLKEPVAAADGRLGEMRNRACRQAKYDNITILDDDMTLSTSWYKNLLKFGEDFDMLTSKVILPDGTRFWDHATFCPPELPSSSCHGHVILEANETDEHLYMSGGQAWIMKKYVFEKAQWNTIMSTGYRANMKNVTEYFEGKHNEDTDFAKNCRDSGFKVSHCHEMVAFHNDAIYSCVGRVCNPRKEGRTYEWVKDLDMYKLPEEIAEESKKWYQQGYLGETADVLRYGLLFHFNNRLLTNALGSLELEYGGPLSDNNWNIDGDPLYNKEIDFYKNYDCSKMST